jgi:hypothetical protein
MFQSSENSIIQSVLHLIILLLVIIDVIKDLFVRDSFCWKKLRLKCKQSQVTNSHTNLKVIISITKTKLQQRYHKSSEPNLMTNSSFPLTIKNIRFTFHPRPIHKRYHFQIFLGVLWENQLEEGGSHPLFSCLIAFLDQFF